MDIGIGLPNTITDLTGDRLTEWARRADAAGFSALGTIDRVVHGNYEPLLALSAAAAVTERIKLMTTVLLVPPRVSPTVLAKQTATLQALSGGRFVLGAGLGGREDDYEATGRTLSERAERMDETLAVLKGVWSGEADAPLGEVGPDVSAKLPGLVIGGSVDASFRRAAQADGWIMGGGTPENFADGKVKLDEAWSSAGREGTPYAGSLAYFSLGPDAQRDAEVQIGGYYSFLGDVAQYIVAGVVKDPDAVRQRIQAFADAGCQELILFPASSDPEQVDLLAEVAL